MSSLVVVEEGEKRFLEALASSWTGNLQMGLHQTDSEPQRNWTLNQIQVCNFSGYSGLIPIVAWQPVTLVAQKAIITAAPLGWSHNGGANGGYVCGYYVVNANGKLVWAQKDDPPYAFLNVTGQQYTVRPAFSLWSWFPLL